MREVVTKTIKIICETLPPRVDFLEQEIEKRGIEPLRYAIVDVEGQELTLTVSGRESKS